MSISARPMAFICPTDRTIIRKSTTTAPSLVVFARQIESRMSAVSVQSLFVDQTESEPVGILELRWERFKEKKDISTIWILPFDWKQLICQFANALLVNFGKKKKSDAKAVLYISQQKLKGQNWAFLFLVRHFQYA